MKEPRFVVRNGSHFKTSSIACCLPDFSEFGRCVTSPAQRVAVETCSRDFASRQEAALLELRVGVNGTDNLAEVLRDMCR